jgi:hypothetical protein
MSNLVIPGNDLLLPVQPGERREAEEYFVRRVGQSLAGRLSGLGIKLLDVVGYSDIGWRVAFQAGDGWRSYRHFEPQELFAHHDQAVIDGSATERDFIAESAKCMLDGVIEDVHLHLYPPPPPPEQILAGDGMTGLQLGEGIKDSLGDDYYELKETIEAEGKGA